MNTCKATIKHTAKDIGIYAHSKCGKSVVDKGLCQGHLNAYNKKQINWGERTNYKQVTIECMGNGTTMKLKSENKNNVYKLVGDRICQLDPKTNRYNIQTNLAANPELFCNKIM